MRTRLVALAVAVATAALPATADATCDVYVHVPPLGTTPFCIDFEQ